MMFDTLKKKQYHAGVRRFSFGCISSPAYLSEFLEYLYVGGKYIFPSFHPTKTRPCLCSMRSCQENSNKISPTLSYDESYKLILTKRMDKNSTQIVKIPGPFPIKLSNFASQQVLWQNGKRVQFDNLDPLAK